MIFHNHYIPCGKKKQAFCYKKRLPISFAGLYALTEEYLLRYGFPGDVFGPQNMADPVGKIFSDFSKIVLDISPVRWYYIKEPRKYIAE